VQKKTNDLEVIIGRFGGCRGDLGRGFLRGIRGIWVRLGGVLGEFGGILGGLGLSSWDFGGLGLDRTRPRVETARGGRAGRQALRVLGKSARAYACASDLCARACACVLLGKRASATKQPQT
jgi:hypothetical protein